MGRWSRRVCKRRGTYLVAVEPDAAKASLLHTRLIEAGLYGSRATVLVSTTESLELPPYLASSMICESSHGAVRRWSPSQSVGCMPHCVPMAVRPCFA